MRRYLIFSICLVFALSISAGMWKFYHVLVTQKVNRDFCQLRAEIERVNGLVFQPYGDLKTNLLVQDLVRQKVGKYFSELIQSQLLSWEPFRSRFDAENEAEFQNLQRQIENSLGLSQVQFCQKKDDIDPTDRLPYLLFKSLPRPWVMEPHSISTWIESLDTLRAKVPVIEGQLRDDTRIICASALDLKRTQKIAAFYANKCPHCQKNKDYQKVISLRQKHKSHLQQNLSQFRIKWSDVETQKLECLKGLLDEATNLNETTLIENFSNFIGPQQDRFRLSSRDHR